MLSSDPRAKFGFYSHFAPLGGPASNQIWPTAATADTFVSCLNYERYVRFGLTEGQIERTHSSAVHYDELFKLPYLEADNGRPSFAFFNPALRVVALDGNAERLKPIAQALQREAPNLRVTFVNPSR